jgi:hypothetical protein
MCGRVKRILMIVAWQRTSSPGNYYKRKITCIPYTVAHKKEEFSSVDAPASQPSYNCSPARQDSVSLPGWTRWRSPDGTIVQAADTSDIGDHCSVWMYAPQHSPYWEARGRSACLEMFHLLLVPELHYHLASKELCRRFTTLRTTGFLDFVHSAEFLILENATFANCICFRPQVRGGHLLCWPSDWG